MEGSLSQVWKLSAWFETLRESNVGYERFAMPAVACVAEGSVLQQAVLARISFVLHVSCLVILWCWKRGRRWQNCEKLRPGHYCQTRRESCSQSDVTERTCWCCYQEAWEKCDWMIAVRMCLWRKEAICKLLQCFSLPSNIVASFPCILFKQLFCIYDPICSSYRAIFAPSHLHCNSSYLRWMTARTSGLLWVRTINRAKAL